MRGEMVGPQFNGHVSHFQLFSKSVMGVFPTERILLAQKWASMRSLPMLMIFPGIPVTSHAGRLMSDLPHATAAIPHSGEHLAIDSFRKLGRVLLFLHIQLTPIGPTRIPDLAF